MKFENFTNKWLIFWVYPVNNFVIIDLLEYAKILKNWVACFMSSDRKVSISVELIIGIVSILSMTIVRGLLSPSTILWQKS